MHIPLPITFSHTFYPLLPRPLFQISIVLIPNIIQLLVKQSKRQWTQLISVPDQVNITAIDFTDQVSIGGYDSINLVSNRGFDLTIITLPN